MKNDFQPEPSVIRRLPAFIKIIKHRHILLILCIVRDDLWTVSQFKRRGSHAVISCSFELKASDDFTVEQRTLLLGQDTRVGCIAIEKPICLFYSQKRFWAMSRCNMFHIIYVLWKKWRIISKTKTKQINIHSVKITKRPINGFERRVGIVNIPDDFWKCQIQSLNNTLVENKWKS